MGALYYAKIEKTKFEKVDTQLTQAKEDLSSLKSALDKQIKISDVTEEVVTNAVVKTAEITQASVKISKKVDKTNQEAKDGKINYNIASAAYVDSMWDAYCTATPTSTSSKCTSRRTTSGLPN